MPKERKTFCIPVYANNHWNISATDTTGRPYIIATTGVGDLMELAENSPQFIYIEPSGETNQTHLSDEETKFMEDEVKKAISEAATAEVSNQLKNLSAQASKLKTEITALKAAKKDLKAECETIAAEAKSSLSEISKIIEDHQRNVMRFLHLDMGE